jgi:capsule polysaccharide export protein KpsE/RkpR
MDEETDPEIKAAQEKAIEARKERDEAEERVKEADDEVEKLKATKQGNLDASDQGAIQGATQSGIDTAR